MMRFSPWGNPQMSTCFLLFGLGTIILALINQPLLATLTFVLFVLSVNFFLDPPRTIPQDEGQVVSPADGLVTAVEELESHPLVDGPVWRVSVFMSVFDVHVNRSPLSGRVVSREHHPGQFLNAMKAESAEFNERVDMVIEDDHGLQVGVVQIAGLIARRIVCDVSLKQRLVRGERFGMIKFGSRVDLVVARDRFAATVKVGDKVKAGASILGQLSS